MALTTYGCILPCTLSTVNPKCHWNQKSRFTPLEPYDEFARLQIRGWLWYLAWSIHKYIYWLSTALSGVTNWLAEYEDANVRSWAIHKKGAVIKAGLNKACSHIQSHFFDELRNHTNAVEQSHQKSYASGKYLTLVEAVKKWVLSSLAALSKWIDHLTDLIPVLQNWTRKTFFSMTTSRTLTFIIHIEHQIWRRIIFVIWVVKACSLDNWRGGYI